MLTALKRILKMCGHAFTITVHERLDTLEQRSAETDNALLQASIRMAERLPQGATYGVVDAPQSVPAFSRSGTWVRLIAHLYSHVRSRTACRIGACPEEAALSAAGYQMAPDASEGARELGLLIAESPAQLAQSLGERRPEVTITGTPDDFVQLVEQMRARGYHWYLVVHGEGDGGSFYANYPVRVQAWAGHAFFFRDRETFAEAHSWCAALLKRTYFRFPAGSN